jgi:hypothetical protein
LNEVRGSVGPRNWPNNARRRWLGNHSTSNPFVELGNVEPGNVEPGNVEFAR